MKKEGAIEQIELSYFPNKLLIFKDNVDLFLNPYAPEDIDKPLFAKPLEQLLSGSLRRGARERAIMLTMIRFLSDAIQRGSVESILAHTSQTLASKGHLGICADSPTDLSAGSSKSFRSFGVYYDASFAFALTLDFEPLAVVGFNQAVNYIDVLQLQGVKGKERSRHLNRLGRWEQRLLQIVEDYAYYCGIPEVRVRRGADNGWIKYGVLTLDRAFARYDRTALALGYTYDSMVNRFAKQIPVNPAPQPMIPEPIYQPAEGVPADIKFPLLDKSYLNNGKLDKISPIFQHFISQNCNK